MTALQGFSVIELAERPAGEFCGKLLSDFGAEVIKLERPGSGSPTRAMAPIVGEGGVENSGLFAYLNTNKRSVALDLESKSGLELMHKLIATADVVIDDHDEDWLKRVGLSPADAERDHPSVIVCSITPFGHGAPREFWTAKSLNVFHASGWGYHTPSKADESKPPLKGPGRFVADYDGALDAALCIVSSLHWRRQTKQGQFIDVSQTEALASRADVVIGRFITGEVDASTSRSAYDMGGPQEFFRCADGFVYLVLLHSNHWKALRNLMGNPEWMNQFTDDWLEFGVTREAVADVRARFAAWVRDEKKDEVSARAQKIGVTLVAVNDASDVQRSEQSIFRGYFQRLKHPVLGEALYPTVPYKLSVTPVKLTDPAPLLGQHTAAVLERDEAGSETVAPVRRAGE